MATPYEKLRGDLKRIANGFHHTATRVGEPGCRVRRAAQENEQTMQDAIAALDCAYLPLRRAVGMRGPNVIYEFAAHAADVGDGWEMNPESVVQLDRVVNLWAAAFKTGRNEPLQIAQDHTKRLLGADR